MPASLTSGLLEIDPENPRSYALGEALVGPRFKTFLGSTSVSASDGRGLQHGSRGSPTVRGFERLEGPHEYPGPERRDMTHAEFRIQHGKQTVDGSEIGNRESYGHREYLAIMENNLELETALQRSLADSHMRSLSSPPEFATRMKSPQVPLVSPRGGALIPAASSAPRDSPRERTLQIGFGPAPRSVTTPDFGEQGPPPPYRSPSDTPDRYQSLPSTPRSQT